MRENIKYVELKLFNLVLDFNNEKNKYEIYFEYTEPPNNTELYGSYDNEKSALLEFEMIKNYYK